MNNKSKIMLAVITAFISNTPLLGVTIFDVLRERNLIIKEKVDAIKAQAKDRELTQEETTQMSILNAEHGKNQTLIEEYAKQNEAAKQTKNYDFLPSNPAYYDRVLGAENQKTPEFKQALKKANEKRELQRKTRAASQISRI